MVRCVVYGGRDFKGRDELFAFLDEIDRTEVIDEIIEGEMTGADRLARAWAESRGVPFHPFPADWDNITRPGAVVRRNRAGKLYDAAAGPFRNQRMIDEGFPDLAVECPGGDGTKDMRGRLESAGIPIRYLGRSCHAF